MAVEPPVADEPLVAVDLLVVVVVIFAQLERIIHPSAVVAGQFILAVRYVVVPVPDDPVLAVAHFGSI